LTVGEPQALKEILAALASKAAWNVPRATQQIAEVWARIAPPGLVTHCWVSSLVRGVLVLDSDAPVWAQEVRMVAPELTVRINEEVGEPVVHDIVVTMRRRRGRGQGDPRV